ncbi:U20-hexatoxin-Hi1a-like [Parasteatoda tepidariorum]|uniref:U20-hexatoxin-Hi1a-like n=1 Tax=Parasteatoda tepidariorum TaxID=114398 RepID=UPI001C71BD12|nr:U24-ctenitoxin-Pn1a-like [Parasteatoda tepidariorum]XP_015921560.2 U24-ctenitoxin-Pn1a-like [Parasteatoda tepidariorum]
MKAFLIATVALCCLAGVFAKTACEEHREREQKSNTKVKLVPKCTPEGDYEALQCFEGSKFCMCWRPDGSHIVDPSLKVKSCVCHVHKDRELQKSSKGMVGNFIPQCNDDGTYARKQCHGSTGFCWCADEAGKKVSESVRGDPNC